MVVTQHQQCVGCSVSVVGFPPGFLPIPLLLPHDSFQKYSRHSSWSNASFNAEESGQKVAFNPLVCSMPQMVLLAGILVSALNSRDILLSLSEFFHSCGYIQHRAAYRGVSTDITVSAGFLLHSLSDRCETWRRESWDCYEPPGQV